MNVKNRNIKITIHLDDWVPDFDLIRSREGSKGTERGGAAGGRGEDIGETGNRLDTGENKESECGFRRRREEWDVERRKAAGDMVLNRNSRITTVKKTKDFDSAKKDLGHINTTLHYS